MFNISDWNMMWYHIVLLGINTCAVLAQFMSRGDAHPISWVCFAVQIMLTMYACKRWRESI